MSNAEDPNFAHRATGLPEDPEGAPEAVVLPYKTPGERARAKLEESIVVAVGTTLLSGLLQVLVAYSAGQVADQKTILVMVGTLLINCGLLGLKKYADAQAEE